MKKVIAFYLITLQLVSLFCSQENRESIESSELIEGYSLFKNEMYLRVKQLLQKPQEFRSNAKSQNRDMVLDVLRTISSDINQNERGCQPNDRLSIPQQFALDLLIEELLNRSDAIIADPKNALLRSNISELPNSTTPLPQRYTEQPCFLKTFEEVKDDKYKLRFLKLYKLCCRVQRESQFRANAFDVPESFNLISYMNTSSFDHYFENDPTRDENCFSAVILKNFSLLSPLRDLGKSIDSIQNPK